jgi:hypothetical protein
MTQCKGKKKKILLYFEQNPAGLGVNSAKVGTIVRWRFDQNASRQALASMIILDELPFFFVEGEGFKKFVAISCPRFHIPSRWSITKDCFDLYLLEKTKLKSYLRSNSQRVCLTTDTWTSLQKK